jgi:hypothetical protein
MPKEKRKRMRHHAAAAGNTEVMFNIEYSLDWLMYRCAKQNDSLLFFPNTNFHSTYYISMSISYTTCYHNAIVISHTPFHQYWMVAPVVSGKQSFTFNIISISTNNVDGCDDSICQQLLLIVSDCDK